MQRFSVTDMREGEPLPGGRRLAVSVCLALVLLYLSLGQAGGLPLPPFLNGGGWGALALAVLELALALPVCVLHRAVFAAGWRDLRRLAPGADTLLALGAGLSLLYGVFAAGMIAAGVLVGNEAQVLQYRRDLSLGAAAIILTIAAGAEFLCARWQRRATAARRALAALAPATACLLRDEGETTIPAGELRVGDLFLVRPGERFPADGVVTAGESTVDAGALTGAEAPENKAPGDPVLAAACNGAGALTCRATRVGPDTALARLVRLAQQAGEAPGPQARQADRVAAVLTPAIIGLAAVTAVVWLLLGYTLPFALARCVSVLAVGCPCAIGLAAPAARLVADGIGARRGFVCKTAAGLEEVGGVGTVLLDKDSAVTAGAPAVVEIVGTRKVPDKFLLGMAAGLESQSDDPVARAIMARAKADGIRGSRVASIAGTPGQGLAGKFAGKIMAGGNQAFIETQCALPDDLREAGAGMEKRGITPLYFSLDGHAAGVIGVADVVKPGSKAAVAALRALGLRVVLLARDGAGAAAHIAGLIGLDAADVEADLPADGMAEAVRRFRRQGKVAMVGDSAADGPALAAADTGVAIGVQGLLAPDDADLLLLRGNLTELPAAVRLSRRMAQIVTQGVRGACLYNLIGLLVAVGLLYPLGVLLSPAVAALLAALARLAALANAGRLGASAPHAAPDDAPAGGDAA